MKLTCHNFVGNAIFHSAWKLRGISNVALPELILEVQAILAGHSNSSNCLLLIVRHVVREARAKYSSGSKQADLDSIELFSGANQPSLSVYNGHRSLSSSKKVSQLNRKSKDSNVEIVVETQESQQHFHPDKSMSMSSIKVSNHPQKLFCRRTQLPQPMPRVIKNEDVPFSNMHFAPFNQYPLPIMPQFVDPKSCNTSNLYIPQASMSHVPPVPIQDATTDSNTMKKRPRGRPKKSLEKSGEGKKDCKEEFNGKYSRWDDKFTLALNHVRGEMQDEFSTPPKQGINLWHTVLTRIVARCPGFDKDAAACRKKWRSIYKDYAKGQMSQKRFMEEPLHKKRKMRKLKKSLQWKKN